MKILKCVMPFQQKGAETLEFVVIFGWFMMFLMAVFDFGRAMYVWNALAEATRRGARMAVVCPSNQNNIVQRVAVFDVVNGNLGSSPIVKGLTPGAISVTYFDAAGTSLGSTPADPKVIAFAEVAINNNYQFQFVIPYITDNIISVPTFRARLYSESKGAMPTIPPAAAIAPTCAF